MRKLTAWLDVGHGRQNPMMEDRPYKSPGFQFIIYNIAAIQSTVTNGLSIRLVCIRCSDLLII